LADKTSSIPKSRETGISWMIGGALAAWDWIFHDQTHIGFVSKDLLSANNPDDPDALFSKFHFLLEHLAVLDAEPDRLRAEHHEEHLPEPAKQILADCVRGQG
jgi:hypothetical protein